MQKHRRMRGIRILSKGLISNDFVITRSTAANFCIPLGLKGLLQNDQDETLHVGLMNHCVELLTNASRIVKWNDCMRLVKLIIDTIHQNRNRESLLLRALIQILTAFDYQIEDAAIGFLQATTNISDVRLGRNEQLRPDVSSEIAKSVAIERELAKREREERNKKKNEEEMVLPASVELQILENDELSTEEGINAIDDKIIEEQEIFSAAQNQISVLQRSIKVQLIPMLKRLMVLRNQRADKDDSQHHNAAVALETKRGSGTSTVHQTQTLIRPQIVSLILQVAKHLPTAQFHSELPRLLNTVATCLA